MLQNQKKIATIESSIPIHALEDDLVILEDGSVAIGYQVELWSDEQVDGSVYENHIAALSRTIKRFPVGTVVQQLDIYNVENFEVKKGFPYVNFFHKKQFHHYKGRAILVHHCYIFIICTPFFGGIDPHLTLFSMGNKGIINPFKKLPTTIEQVRKCAQEFELSLPEGWIYQQIKAKENLALIYSWLNLDFSGQSAGLETSLMHNKDDFKVGNLHCNIISMQSQSGAPNYFGKNDLGIAGGVTVPFTWNLSHYLGFPHVTIQALQVQDTQTFLQNRTREWEWSQGVQHTQRGMRNVSQDMEGIIAFESAIRAQEEAIVNLNYLVMVYDSDPAALHKQTEQVKKAFRQLDMLPFLEGYDTANLYFSSMPAAATQLYRGQPMALTTALAYFNTITPKRGAKEGVLLANRQEAPIFYNPFNIGLDNQNVFIFGPSGSGKSFFNGKMIKDRFQAGHIVMVIDSGGTYKRLFEILGGKYIAYSAEKPLALNPFLIAKNKMGQFRPDVHKITFLIQFIGKIWKGDLNKHPLSQVEQTLLSKWIGQYYDSLQDKDAVPSLTHFYDYVHTLFQHKDPSIAALVDRGLFAFDNFLIVLEPFAHGIYQPHFNSNQKAYLSDHKLVCFELEAIKNNPKLYPLVVQVLFEFALEMVEKYPDVAKFIDIEEGWTMLNDYSEENIEAFFRKGRKTKTSIRIITQDVNEIKGSRIAGAMKNNASTFILLYNEKKSSREEIGQFFGMTPLDMEKYESLRRKTGRNGYREIFIKEMHRSFVYLIHTSLWEHALLTSRPDERNRITQLIQAKDNAQLGIAEWVDEQNKLRIR